MKRLMAALTAAGLVACGASAQTITSVNSVGFHSVDVPPGGDLVLVAPTLESMGGGTLEELIGDQLPAGAIAHIWQRDTRSYTTVPKSSKNGWGSATIERGDAVWLLDPNATTTQRVSFAGEVPDVRSLTATTTVSIGAIDAVAYPYPTEIDFTNTTLAQASVPGDVVHFWRTADQAYTTVPKSSKNGWGSSSTKVLAIGEAFWYQPLDGSEDWVEVIKYDLSN